PNPKNRAIDRRQYERRDSSRWWRHGFADSAGAVGAWNDSNPDRQIRNRFGSVLGGWRDRIAAVSLELCAGHLGPRVLGAGLLSGTGSAAAGRNRYRPGVESLRPVDAGPAGSATSAGLGAPFWQNGTGS